MTATKFLYSFVNTFGNITLHLIAGVFTLLAGCICLPNLQDQVHMTALIFIFGSSTLRTEVLCTPSSTGLGFKFMTVGSKFMTFHATEMPALTTRSSVTSCFKPTLWRTQSTSSICIGWSNNNTAANSRLSAWPSVTSCSNHLAISDFYSSALIFTHLWTSYCSHVNFVHWLILYIPNLWYS